MPITVVLFAACFVAAAVMIDWLRRKLFAVLKVDAAGKALEMKLQGLFSKQA